MGNKFFIIMSNLISFLESTVNKRIKAFVEMEKMGGYANGYVAVPPGHPLWGMDYDNVDNKINIHGGLTYSDMSDNMMESQNIEILDETVDSLPSGWWVFGFDTLHYMDTLENWSREMCIKETLELRKQLEEYK